MTATATAVREAPILMSGPMVRAILRDVDPKTQTRRVVNLPAWMVKRGATLDNAWADPGLGAGGYLKVRLLDDDTVHRVRCPHGEIGDRLWVREAFSTHVRIDEPFYLAPDYHDSAMGAWYWADGNPDHGDWTKPKPSIHMPRWASRLTLEITNVRVERLQGITPSDCVDEGIVRLAIDATLDQSHPLRKAMFARGDHVFAAETGEAHPDGPFAGTREMFAALWDSLNAKRGYSWDSNPSVWVIEFKRVAP